MRSSYKLQQGNTGVIFIIIVVIAVALILLLTGNSGEEGPHNDDAMMMEDDAMMMEDDGAMMAEEVAYEVTVSNLSSDQPLSPGVYVLHTAQASINFVGQNAPAELEPLAEYGAHAAFRDLAQTVPGVVSVHTVDAPILPGESASFMVSAPADEALLLSGIQMAVASNDGYAFVDALALDPAAEASAQAVNLDNGTEENTELGSGFDGGQPDPTRGEENVDNGTATDPQEAVAIHDQLLDPIMAVSVMPQS